MSIVRRIAVLLLVGFLIGFAAPAEAAAVDGGTLVPGVYVTATIAAGGPDVSYALPVTRTGHMTIDVRDNSWAVNADLQIITPLGQGGGSCNPGNGFCNLYFYATGTAHIVVHARNGLAGHLRFAFARDQTNGPLADGQVVNGVVHYQGQRMSWTYSGSKLDWYTLTVNSAKWAPTWAPQAGITAQPAWPSPGSGGNTCTTDPGSVCYIPVLGTGTFDLTIMPSPAEGATGSVNFTWQKLKFDTPAAARAFTPPRGAQVVRTSR